MLDSVYWVLRIIRYAFDIFAEGMHLISLLGFPPGVSLLKECQSKNQRNLRFPSSHCLSINPLSVERLYVAYTVKLLMCNINRLPCRVAKGQLFRLDTIDMSMVGYSER